MSHQHSDSDEEEETINYGMHDDQMNPDHISLNHLYPGKLPANDVLPFRLRQPSRWAREQFDQAFDSNDPIMTSRQRLLFDENLVNESIEHRRTIYEEYLKQLGEMSCSNNNNNKNTLHNFPWEKTLPMDSLGHERLFCLHNLAMLQTKEAANMTAVHQIKEQRQAYVKAARYWHLVGELAENSPTTLKSSDWHDASCWEQVALALAQQSRLNEIDAIDPNKLGDLGTHRFMIGQAATLARERWKKIQLDTCSNELSTAVSVLSQVASAQHYMQWARFHAVPPEQGGRGPEACEYRVAASITLLSRAHNRLMQAYKTVEKESSRLEHKVTDGIHALLGKQTSSSSRQRLKQWFDDERLRLENALTDERTHNHRVTIEPELEYSTLALETLKRTRDGMDDPKDIQAMREQLRVLDVTEEALQYDRDEFGLCHNESTMIAAPTPAENNNSTLSLSKTMKETQNTAKSRYPALYQVFKQTQNLWSQVHARLGPVHNGHLSRGMWLIEHHMNQPKTLPSDMQSALLNTLIEEIQPFCQLFLPPSTSSPFSFSTTTPSSLSSTFNHHHTHGNQ